MSAAATLEGTEGAERPKRTWSQARRDAAAAGRRRRGDAPEPSDSELIAEEVVGEAVANVITLSGFLMPVAPYTAVTIAGVPGENEGEWVVRSRAEMAGSVLLEHAKRNRRVLAAIARFNLLFKNVELVEVVGSVVASAAVDAQLVEPDATMALPGGLTIPILAPAIGDTIAYIAGQEEAARAQGIEVPRRRRAEARAAEGTHVGTDPYVRDEPTPEQRAEAAATRARLLAREEAIANGTDPTLRREGQTKVPGDVTKT